MNRKVKVLHFISNAARSFYLNAIAECADRQRFDLTFGTLSSAGLLQKDIIQRGHAALALNCEKRSQYPLSVIRLAGWLKRQRIDILQTHLFDASLIGLIAGRLSGTPLLILTGHHSHEFSHALRPRNGKPAYWLDCLMSRYLSYGILSPSRDMKDIFMRDEGVPEGKIKVIPYGFNLGDWQASSLARSTIRQELGLQGKTVLGAVGRLYWVKDYPTLLRAFARVASAHSDLVLLIVGVGPEDKRLQDLANELGIQSQVLFIGYRSDIQEVMAAIDVLVHVSLGESFCQVVVEAFAQEIPVVSTPVGVSPEIIETGKNGILVPAGDPGALTLALEKMLSWRGRWREMGREGRRLISEFSVDKVVPRYEAQYLEWLEERRGSVRA